jgi:hypothetical protein
MQRSTAHAQEYSQLSVASQLCFFCGRNAVIRKGRRSDAAYDAVGTYTPTGPSYSESQLLLPNLEVGGEGIPGLRA